MLSINILDWNDVKGIVSERIRLKTISQAKQAIVQNDFSIFLLI